MANFPLSKDNLDQWANITVRMWQRKLTDTVYRTKKSRKANTGALLKSFQHFVNYQTGGGIASIEIDFNMYGRYVEMGVGNKSRRKPQAWYSKTMRHEFLVLVEIIQKALGAQAQQMVIYTLGGGKVL